AFGAKEFFRTEGAVGLLTWFESIEAVLYITKCPAESQAEFASCMLQEYCPDDEVEKLESEFWNHKMVGSDIDGYTARFHELARLVPHMGAVNMANRLTTDGIKDGIFKEKENAGNKKSRYDSSLFIYGQGMDTAYLLLYVDDVVLTASSETLLQRIIASLHHEFFMTDLGSLNYVLGISITWDSFGMFLSQRKYAIKILEWVHMVNCNPSRTPVDTNSKLGDDGDLVSNLTLYRSFGGSLQYLTFTHPNISYAVQQICLYMHDPREPHLSALKRILRLVFLLLRDRLQVEYCGVANGVAKTCWLKNLLFELHTPLSFATLFYCENTEVGEGKLLGPEIVQETTDKIAQIKERLKVIRDLQKSYAEKRQKPLEFSVGDKVLIKVSPRKGVVRFDEVKVDEKLHFVEEAIGILDRGVKKLERRWIPIVKVRWNSRRGPKVTWELEDEMKR
nr:hypothetical protein [Tanacetum cinerariifolium]